MMKEDELIGVVIVYRQKVRPFSEKQIELVKNFAAQAVIAIENARLLNELRQRTADLTEALEQQMATSEVLKVVSSSPSDLQPVFEAMLDNATRICQAPMGTMVLYENGGFRHVALHGAPAAYAELRAREPVVTPKPAQGLGRLLRTKQVVHIADIFSEPAEARGGLAELAGARTLLIVPMLKEQELLGSLGIYRQEMTSASARRNSGPCIFMTKEGFALSRRMTCQRHLRRCAEEDRSLLRRVASLTK
jgi:GAF domain-containing protein